MCSPFASIRYIYFLRDVPFIPLSCIVHYKLAFGNGWKPTHIKFIG